MTPRATLLLGLGLVGCAEDTGSGLVQFSASAAGPERAIAGQPYEFQSAAGYHVRLDRARLTIGALYLNRSRPTLGAQDTPCVLPGVYVGEVTSSVVIDALSSEPVAFGTKGHGTADRALAGEVWLTGERIDATDDRTNILEFAGMANRGDSSFGFYGVVTIGQNRSFGSADPAAPGANPPCKLRIVTPIPLDVTLSNGGTLRLRVDPEIWFDHVDFSGIQGAQGHGELLEIPDASDNPAGVDLFQGLRTLTAYRLDWTQ
jgi:hypothetical protein